jgi:hypothetical protein
MHTQPPDRSEQLLNWQIADAEQILCAHPALGKATIGFYGKGRMVALITPRWLCEI